MNSLTTMSSPKSVRIKSYDMSQTINTYFSILFYIFEVTKRPRKLAVFVNPIGGKGKGKQVCDQTVVPVLQLAGIQTDVVGE